MKKFAETVNKNGGVFLEARHRGKTTSEIQGLTSSPLIIFGDWVSPEDHQFKVGEVQDDLSCANEEIERLNAKLEKQQPEIPYFVAEGIKSIPYHYTAFGAMLLVKEKIEITKGGDINSDWLPLYNWLFSNNEINSQDLFSQAWLNGYTVAKEKRFYLKNKLTGQRLIRLLEENGGGFLECVTSTDKERMQFTQSEIDSMETGSYEQIEVVE